MAKSSTSSYVLTLKLNTDASDEAFLAKRMFLSCKIYNQLVSHVRRQLKKLYSDYRYKEGLQILQSIKSKKDADSKHLRFVTGKQLADIRLEYGLSEYQLYNYVKQLQHTYKYYLGSQTCQKIAADVWVSVEKYLFGKGRSIHYKRCISENLLHGSNTNQTYMTFDLDKKSVRIGGYEISADIDHNDLYVCYALQDKIKYCQIVRKPFNTGYHYYLQLVLTGTPPKKHVISNGKVGIDIGTSTIAVSSENTVMLQQLSAERVDYSKQINKIQRAMDRSRRANNPDKYNADGTINKYNHDKWILSKSYKQLAMRKRTLERKQADSLKTSHGRLSNEIISLGNDIYVETMRYAGMQRRKKETTVSKSGRYQRKRRFGSSIKNNAPAMLIAMIGKKLHYQDAEIHKVNTITFRASQYDHHTDEYIKKKLSARSVQINGIKLQRDLYSAFLLMNSDKSLEQTNRDDCINTFDKFLVLHNDLINKLVSQYKQGMYFPSCMGIKDFCN